jgi:hypothetical protein
MLPEPKHVVQQPSFLQAMFGVDCRPEIWTIGIRKSEFYGCGIQQGDRRQGHDFRTTANIRAIGKAYAVTWEDETEYLAPAIVHCARIASPTGRDDVRPIV